MKYDIYRAQAIDAIAVQVQAPAVDKPPIRPIHTIPTNGTSAGWSQVDHGRHERALRKNHGC